MRSIIVNDQKVQVKVDLMDIFYIIPASDKNHILKVVTVNGVYEIYNSLTNVEDKLSFIFYRCHRKYIVNLEKIRALDKVNRTIMFLDEAIDTISYSRLKQKELEKLWEQI